MTTSKATQVQHLTCLATQRNSEKVLVGYFLDNVRNLLSWNIFLLSFAWLRIYFSILYWHCITLKSHLGRLLTWWRDRILLSPGQQEGKCIINPTQLNRHNLPGREISHRPCGDCFRRCLTGSIKLEKSWLATRPGWKFHREESIWEIDLEMLQASSFLGCFRFRFYWIQDSHLHNLQYCPHKRARCSEH